MILLLLIFAFRRPQRLLIIALLCSGLAVPVYAQTPTPFPTPSGALLANPANAFVYRSLIEPNDYLLVFQYSLAYNPAPTGVPASQTFLARLFNPSGVQVGANTLTATGHPELGYITGVGSIYISAASAPTWECACTLEIDANPGINGLQAIPSTQYILQASDYEVSSAQADNQVALGNWVLARAGEIQGELSPVQTWTTSGQLGTQLTLAGTTYFSSAIPGLYSMAPDIFQTKTILPTVVPATISGAYATALAQNDNIIGTPLQETASAWGLSKFELGFFLAVIFLIMCIGLSVKLNGSPTAGAILAGISIFLMAPVIGFLSLTITLVIGLFLIIIMAAALFLMRG